MPTTPMPIKGPTSHHPEPAAVNLDKEETPNEYCPGGYHPISLGDELNDGRYNVVRKLGWGHFSTVWLVQDQTNKVHVALKVVKSSPKYAQTARDEIALLNHVKSAPNPNHPGRDHVVQFLDSFEIIADQPPIPPHYDPLHPYTPPRQDLRHVCMTFEPLGENLLSLLRRLQTCDRTNLKKGIPRVLVRQIVRQMLQALDFLHKDCRLIHTDLKPENVLVVVDNVEELVRACAASEEMTGVSPSTANRVVPIPRSANSRYEPGGGDWHNQKNVQIYGSYPLPSPMQEWGRKNAGAEVGSLALIMSQLASESAADAAKQANAKEMAERSGSDKARPTTPEDGVDSGASSFVSSSTSARTMSSLADVSTAPTSLESSMIIGEKRELMMSMINNTAEKLGALSLLAPESTTDGRTEIDDRVSAHSDATLNVQPLDERPSLETNLSSATVTPNVPTPSPTPVPVKSTLPVNTPSLLSANAPPPAERGRQTFGIPAATSTSPQVAPPRIRIKIADLGNATPTHKHFTPDIQTRQYRCPEVILGYKDWDETVDIWSVGTLVFELLTSDFLFAPQAKSEFTKDDDHMAQIVELLGDLPEHRKHGGKWSREIFRRNGRLRNIPRLRPWSLKKVLEEKYDYPPKQATALRDFILPMLALDPAQRATAGEMSTHPWLDMDDELPE